MITFPEVCVESFYRFCEIFYRILKLHRFSFTWNSPTFLLCDSNLHTLLTGRIFNNWNSHLLNKIIIVSYWLGLDRKKEKYAESWRHINRQFMLYLFQTETYFIWMCRNNSWLYHYGKKIQISIYNGWVLGSW